MILETFFVRKYDNFNFQKVTILAPKVTFVTLLWPFRIAKVTHFLYKLTENIYFYNYLWPFEHFFGHLPPYMNLVNILWNIIILLKIQILIYDTFFISYFLAKKFQVSWVRILHSTHDIFSNGENYHVWNNILKIMIFHKIFTKFV